MTGQPRILIGMDFGKATASFATGEVLPAGPLSAIQSLCVRHFGDPVSAFAEFYRSLDRRRILGVCVTGVYGDLLAGPVAAGLPEEIAQERATEYLHPGDDPINVLRLGARGYSILCRRGPGNYVFEENDKCSAGTGETIEKICARMGVTLEEAVRLAARAGQSIPITARCSVFAKTEMTHFANQGEPHDQLLLGYFQSVAKNVAGFQEKYKVDGPVILIGNVARIEPILKTLRGLIGSQVQASPEAGVYEALGALYHAADVNWDESLGWPEDPMALVRAKPKRIRSLQPAASMPGSVAKLDDGGAGRDSGGPAVLGIDLGSTGSKAALIDAATGAVIHDFYRRTDGNPVESAKALVAEVMEACDRPVAAVGLTGSGRDAAAVVFRAAYPGLRSQIIVNNEIVAHATAAVALDPGGGRSLSIVEIGGQDAKFINIQDSRVLESDMNRACSAGTGSFLEEQGVFYGVTDVTRFAEMASASDNPPDLGQMCTVFVADLAAEALGEGFQVEDVFAGFQYSVIFNYKNRVMGNRNFLDRVFFQGKPAQSESLARTLAAVTEREVFVPPNPGAMGAIGIAMMAAREAPGLSDIAFDLSLIVNAAVTSRRNFRCNDSRCKNLCRIEAATVAVADQERKVVSGGNCPKYEKVSAGAEKLPADAPHPYREREELIAAILEPESADSEAPAMGLPLGHLLIDYLPFFHTFFTRMGLKVEVLKSDSSTFQKGNRRVSANNTCTPVKILHGLVNPDLPYNFLPKFVEVPRLKKGAGVGTCPMTQAAPEMVEKALEAEGARTRVIRPIFRLGQKGLDSRAFKAEMKKLWEEMEELSAVGQGASFRTAWNAALRKQKDFECGLVAIGRRALVYAEENRFLVVLVMGNSHVSHEPIMNAGIQDLVARNAAIALPLDCFEIPSSIPPLERVYWSLSSRVLRASLAAARKGNIFPLLIVSYGCGPSSFVEHLFNDLLENYPHTVLESDGHGGQAGYVTRVQAFLHAARSYRPGESDPIPPEKIARYDRFPLHDIDELKKAKIVPLTVGPNLARHIAAVLRARGYDADGAPLSDPVGLKKSRRDCSAKECLPHQLIWGAFKKYLEQNPPDRKKTLLLNVTGFGPCRNGMFTLANEIALKKMGMEGKAAMVTFGSFIADPAAFGGIWFSMVGTDLLNLMRLHFRPVEAQPGTADRIFKKYSDRLEGLLERPNTGIGIAGMVRSIPPAREIIEQAAREFQALPVRDDGGDGLRTVYLCGDIYLRIDEWGSDDLTRKLNDLGLRVVVEPFTEMFEFLNLRRSKELVELDSSWLRNKIMRRAMVHTTGRMVSAVRNVLPWIEWDDVVDIEKESRELLDGVPFSESVLTIGSALLAWRKKPVDGVVVVSPWGCGPALISEAQLRRKTEIPLLFVYNDGDPIDQARLAGFAWRLKNRPPRQVARDSKGPREDRPGYRPRPELRGSQPEEPIRVLLK